jgi:hypothetical protein
MAPACVSNTRVSMLCPMMASTAALSSLKITLARCTSLAFTRPLSASSRTATSIIGTEASGASTAV